MILINPVSPNRMGMISRYSLTSLPIGVGTLAGYMVSQGRQVKILDELLSSGQRFIEDIEEKLKGLDKPYIFGISCLTINIGRVYKMAKMLKEKYPDSKVILGGIHPTAVPEEALSKEGVDIVVRGEGEVTLLALFDAIKGGKDYRRVEGISFKDSGQISHNPSRPLSPNLDFLPTFPYGMFDAKRYNLDFIMTSRGCPHNCIFCSQQLISGRRYRFRSLERVAEDLDILINKYKQPSFAFLDDDLLVDKKRAQALCEMIVKKEFHLKANFGCQTRADNVKEEILPYLKAAGFSFIGLGMETGSEKVMKIIQKGETVEANIRAVMMLKKNGFSVNGFFVFGLPQETAQDRLKGYLLAKSLSLDYAKFNNAVPYPGTKLFEIAQKEGTLNIAPDWENFNSVGSVVDGIFSKSKLPYVPANTTELALRRDMVRANLYFYLSKLAAIFAPQKGHPGWFLLPERWYLSPKEYYYLIKLSFRVLINAFIVFDLKWISGEAAVALGKLRRGDGKK